MHQFSVPDMTCGHCVSTITKAVKDADPKAKVEVSLAEHLVKVETLLPQSELSRHIAQAGYTPKAL